MIFGTVVKGCSYLGILTQQLQTGCTRIKRCSFASTLYALPYCQKTKYTEKRLQFLLNFISALLNPFSVHVPNTRGNPIISRGPSLPLAAHQNPCFFCTSVSAVFLYQFAIFSPIFKLFFTNSSFWWLCRTLIMFDDL